MTIDNKFEITQIVMLKTDVEKLNRIVTRIAVSRNGTITYELGCAERSSWHYEFEIEKLNGTNEKRVGFGKD